jgi:1,4-alpha-glucan branching enzyme
MQPPTVFVRLVLLQPVAQSVSVAGDFNGWDPTQTKLERSDGGVWTATIPLKPGRYQYMFVIDGKQWIADPLAAEEATDGFGAQNAVLDVAI